MGAILRPSSHCCVAINGADQNFTSCSNLARGLGNLARDCDENGIEHICRRSRGAVHTPAVEALEASHLPPDQTHHPSVAVGFDARRGLYEPVRAATLPLVTASLTPGLAARFGEHFAVDDGVAACARVDTSSAAGAQRRVFLVAA